MDALLLSLSRYISYRSVAVCVCATPIAHFLGIWLIGLPAWGHKAQKAHKLLLFLAFPFLGGSRSSAFSFAGWVLWAASALVSLQLWFSSPTLQMFQLRGLPQVPHVDAMSGAAAACSFIGLLFLLKSMLVYERPDNPAYMEGAERGVSLIRIRRRLMASPIGQGVLRYGPAAAVLLMGLLLSVTGVLLLLSVEHMPDIPSRLLYCCLSLVCLIIGASSTHGLGGYLQWGRPLSRSTHHAGGAASDSDHDKRCKASASPATGHMLQAPTWLHGQSRVPEGGLVLPDEADLGVSQGQGMLLTGPVTSHANDLAHAAGGAAAMEPISGPLGNQHESGIQGGAGAGVAAGGRLKVLRVSGPLRSEGGLDGIQEEGAWAFFQPFAGGTLFVATQVGVWVLYGMIDLAKSQLTRMTS